MEKNYQSTRGVGRPSKYDPKYCQQVIDHMSQGFSFESFAGKIGVAKDTLYQWDKNHQDFSDAKKEGFEKNRLFWEEQAMRGMWAGKKFNPTVWIFNMKNRFPKEWRDRQEVEAGPETRKTFTLAYKLDKESSDDSKT